MEPCVSDFLLVIFELKWRTYNSYPEVPKPNKIEVSFKKGKNHSSPSQCISEVSMIGDEVMYTRSVAAAQ